MPWTAWNIYEHHPSNGLEIKTVMLGGAVFLSTQQANGRLSNAFCEGGGHSTLKKTNLACLVRALTLDKPTKDLMSSLLVFT